MPNPNIVPQALLFLTLALFNTGCANIDPIDRHDAANQTLDTLHAAASRPDADLYWSLYAPHAVFLGTDGSERWTLEEFKAYANPFFAAGKGWTYTPSDRHIDFLDAHTAFFDEAVYNEKYGPCRGSGVLTNRSGKWLIAQYNLSVPIPNDLLPDVARQIREFSQSHGKQFQLVF